MKAYITYDYGTDIMIRLGKHHFGFGGVGDGFCYECQSFDCIENLTPEEQQALNVAS